MEESMLESKQPIQQDTLNKIKCFKHLQYDKEFIYPLCKEGETPFICFSCLQSQDLLKQSIHIKEIETANEQTILVQIPPFMNQETKEELEIIQNQNLLEIAEQSSQFFSDLRKSISQAIDLVEISHKSKMIQLVETQSNVQEIYNKISQKNELQDCIKDHRKGDDIENKLKEIFKNMNEESYDNQICLEKSIKQFKELRSYFDIISFNQQKDVIIGLINQLSISSEDTQLIRKQSLEDNQSQEEPENDEENQNEEQSVNEKSNEEKNIELLMSLIENPTNYCSQKLLKQIKTLFHFCSPMLSNIEFDLPIENQQLSECFKNISDQQLESLRVLAQKMFEISSQYNQLIESQRNSLDPHIQPLSLKVFSNLKQTINDQMITNLLLKYPIFEINPRQWVDNLLTSYCFEGMTLSSSSKWIQKLTQSQLMISQSQNILEKKYLNSNLIASAHYVIKLLYVPGALFKESQFSCGLIPENQRNNGILSSYKLCFSRNISENNLTKVIKGKDIRSVFDSPNPTEIELRICILKKFFRIADYPNYENVCEIMDPTVFDPAVQYRFGMSYLLNGSIIFVNQISSIVCFDKSM